jgi:hypothetical protein
MPIRITRNGIDFGYGNTGIGSEKASVDTLIGRSPFPYRNMIINGDFSVDQRNCGQILTNNMGGTLQYTADRWGLLSSVPNKLQAQVINDGPLADQTTSGGSTAYYDNTGGQYCYSPKNFQKCIELKALTNYSSLAADDYFYFMQKIEGNIIKTAKFGSPQGNPGKRYILFSCWLKTNLSINNANMDMFVCNDFTNIVSSSSRRFYRWLVTAGSGVYPVGSWVRVHQLIPVDDTSTWYRDSRTGLQLVFVLGAGSNYRSSASTYGSNTWYTTPADGSVQLRSNAFNPSINLAGNVNNYLRITGVQLEYVDVLDSWELQPSSFEIRDQNLERSLCYRYYQKSYNTDVKPGSTNSRGYIWHRDHGYSTVQRYIPWKYTNGPMRASPVLKYYGFNGTADAGYIAGTDYTGVNYGFNGEQSSMFWFSNSSLPSHIDTLFHWTADAEL